MKLPYLCAVLCAASTCLADFDPKNLDASAKPQVDFYQYADGGWIKANPIPADHSSWGAFDELQNNNEMILHGILDKATEQKNPGFVEKLVGDFYSSGMDLATVDAVGISPLKPEFDRIAAIQSSAEVAAEVATLQRLGVGVCFGFGSEQDPKNSEMMIGGWGQGGLGLPERDYYLRTDDASQKLRDKYVEHVVKMLQLAGDSAADARTEAQAIMKLETALAKGSKSEVDLRDPVANYHPMALGDIEKLSPHFDWNAYLSGIGLPAPAMMDIGQPEFLQVLDAQITATPVSDWKAYFRWHLIHDNAPFLSTPFSSENFAFFGSTLTGTPKQRDRWKRVLGEIDDNAGEALGQLYVAVAFPPESKAWMLKLVGNIRQALHDRIEHLEWMDEPTRAAALRKLDMFGVKIGYPDKWIDYSTLVIDRGPYILNVLRANDFNMKRDLAKIGKPVDRTVWGMTPPTVNAYYNPNMNEIVFPAGILQPPFYSKNADDAVNYGGIGAVIGHEMTHGFDDQGRQYDGKGNLADWWSAESKKRFTERSSGIVRQFSGYVAIDELHVNGELTQGENIADLGGIKLSYTALMKTLAGRPEMKVDGFTPEQLFFLSFASIWRDNQRPDALRLQVNTDPHSPARLRVNGPLSNLDEFAAAFDVPEGAPMRRPAADRVNIW
jgi:predicted metalloendopeptidase